VRGFRPADRWRGPKVVGEQVAIRSASVRMFPHLRHVKQSRCRKPRRTSMRRLSSSYNGVTEELVAVRKASGSRRRGEIGQSSLCLRRRNRRAASRRKTCLPARAWCAVTAACVAVGGRESATRHDGWVGGNLLKGCRAGPKVRAGHEGVRIAGTVTYRRQARLITAARVRATFLAPPADPRWTRGS